MEIIKKLFKSDSESVKNHTRFNKGSVNRIKRTFNLELSHGNLENIRHQFNSRQDTY